MLIIYNKSILWFLHFRNVFILINYLQSNNIPHNVYATRALDRDFSSNDSDDTRNCVRVFVWARTPSGMLCCVHTYI